MNISNACRSQLGAAQRSKLGVLGCHGDNANEYYNACSFEPDGTLRWAVRWAAIDGETAGGMDVIGGWAAATPANADMPAIHVLGTKLVAVGVKNGTVHVASLNISDGSESLSLTDTGQDAPDFWRPMWSSSFAHHVVASSEIVIAGLRQDGSNYYLQRFAIDSSGNLTFTESNAYTGGVPSVPDGSTVAIHPSGLVSVLSRTSSLPAVFTRVTVDSSGEYSRDTKTASGAMTFTYPCSSTDSEYIYQLADYTPGGAVDRGWWRWPTSGGPTEIATSVTNTIPNTQTFSNGTLFSGGIEADHAWEVTETNAQYNDLAGDTQEVSVSLLSGISGLTAASAGTRSRHQGPDDLLWLGTYEVSVDECWPVAVKKDGTLYQPSGKFADFDWATVPSASRYPVAYSADTGEALVSVKMAGGVLSGYEVGLMSVSGSALAKGWSWEGAPSALYTHDSSGNYYCANCNADGILDLAGLTQN